MDKQSANQEEGDDGIVDKPSRSHLHEVFADNVTLHGYRYLFDSSSSIARRCAWCVVFFSALVFAIVLFIGVVQDYYMYKSFTVIEVDTDVDEGFDFPTLTFCYNEPFTFRHLKNLKVSKIAENDARTLQGSNRKDVLKLWKYLSGKGPRPHSLLERIFARNGLQIFDESETRNITATRIKGATKRNTRSSSKKKSGNTKKRSKTQKKKKADNTKSNKGNVQKGKRKGKVGKEGSSKNKGKKLQKKKEKSCEQVYEEKLSDYNSEYDYLLNLVSASNIRNFLTDPVSKQFLRDDHNEALYETCRFRHQECRAEDLKMIQLSTGNPCIQFNPYSDGRKSLRQDKASQEAGFTAFLNLYTKDKATGLNRMKLNKFVGAGVYVMINPYGVPVEHGKQLKFMLQPGKLTIINLQGETVVEELPPPHGKCGRKEYSLIKPQYPYSKQMCLLDCDLKYPITECGCVSLEFKDIIKSDVPVCSLNQMAECWNIKRKLGKYSPEVKKCGKESCKSGCGHTEYATQIETNKVGTFRQIMEIQKACNNSRITGELIRRDVAGVQVSFSSMTRRRENVTPSATLMTLVGTIGGSMGLAAGFSLLTLTEFLFFLFDIIFYPCSARLMSTKARDEKISMIPKT